MEQIGEILIEQGSISKDQLKQALEEQKKAQPGKHLGEILIRMGVATDVDIVQALSAQFHFPYLPLKNLSLSGEIFRLIPKELALQYRFIPIEKIKESMTIATADLLDEKAIQEIEEIAKAKVHIFLTTLNEIQTVLQQHYGDIPKTVEKENK